MKKRIDLGERNGSVAEVFPESYQILLHVDSGYRHYQFPKHFATTPLRPGDNVMLYLVDVSGKIEPRIEAMEEPDTSKETDAGFEEIVRKRFAELHKKYGSEPVD